MQRGFVAPLILLVLLLIAVIYGAYSYGKYQASLSPTETSRSVNLPVVSSSPGITLTPSPSTFTDSSSITVKPYTVSFARSGSQIYLMYKGKIYESSSENTYDDPKEVNLRDPDSLTWYGLVDSPITAVSTEAFDDQLFSFRAMPNNDKFVFVMWWKSPRSTATQWYVDYKVYVYDPYQTANKVENVLNSSWPSSDEAPVIRIKQISPDGNYIAFNKHVCWNCDGGSPKILLYNLKTKQQKVIDQVSYFKWKENGQYEYKEMKYEKCKEPGMLEYCPIDAAKLPMLTGNF